MDKTEADPGERVQNSWREAHFQYANIYDVTTKIKATHCYLPKCGAQTAQACASTEGNTNVGDT